ncbi:MAG: TetR/AcrR family transcriptional regulator [Paenalcaligenes sp.]
MITSHHPCTPSPDSCATSSADDKKATEKKPRRRYLPAAKRKQEILDAALTEFASNGYSSTTMESIAASAKISKAGIYAHYRSKEEIFQALMMTVLTPVKPVDSSWMPETEKPSVEEIVDAFLAQQYDKLEDPAVLTTFRLLISESVRVPELIQHWHSQVIDRRVQRDQLIVDECVRRGLLRKSPITENFFLAAAPSLQWVILAVLFNDTDTDRLHNLRHAHRELLLELLRPLAV